MPSRRSSSQSPAGDGSTVPLSSSPSKWPPFTVAMRRRPYGVSPTSAKSGSTSSVSVKRCAERSVGSVMVASKRLSDSSAAAGPVGLAQLTLHDLADRAARQGLTELDGDQPLRLAELSVGPFLDRVLGWIGAIPSHAEGHRRLAPLLARNADHGDIDHVRVLEQQHLDVGGIDVEAAGNDHVLLAVEQDDEAVLVDPAHVARLEEQPAVLVVPEQVARLVVLLVVALHHDLRAPGELADLTLRQHPALLVQHHDLAAQARLAH